MQIISLLELTLVSGRKNRENKQARMSMTANMYRVPYELKADIMNGNVSVKVNPVHQFIDVEIATAKPVNARKGKTFKESQFCNKVQ